MGPPPDAQRRAWIESCFVEHAAGIFVYLSRLIGDEGDAESLTQECFLRLCATEAEFPHEGALQGLALSSGAQSRFRSQQAAAPAPLGRGRPEAAPARALASCLGPRRRSQRKKTSSGSAPRSPALPELYRSTLVLRFLQEWSYEEIAALEEVSVSALRTRIHKGLASTPRHSWSRSNSLRGRPGQRSRVEAAAMNGDETRDRRAARGGGRVRANVRGPAGPGPSGSDVSRMRSVAGSRSSIRLVRRIPGRRIRGKRMPAQAAGWPSAALPAGCAPPASSSFCSRSVC